MLGLDAIEHYNGWAIAFVGAAIVFLGLIFLSFAVSRIHNLLDLWEDRAKYLDRTMNRLGLKSRSSQKLESTELSAEVKTAIKHLMLLTERIGVPFALPKLLELSEKTGMKRPHAITNEALVAGIIVPDGRGYFKWDQAVFERRIVR